MLDLIKNRRSCRGYKSDMVSDNDIEKVVTAGLYAASGMNTQYGKIIVIKNKEIRDKLSSLNASIMGGSNDPFYGAPVILLVMVKKYRNAIYDGSCMIENMMLEASSLGLGSCWIHRAKEELESIEGRKILESTGIDFNEYEGIGHVALGYPLTNSYKEKVIKDDRVIYID